MEDEHERRPRLLHRRDEQQLAPDLELEDQRIPGIQLDDEVLGPPSHAYYPNTSEPAGELLGRRLLDERGVEHLCSLYGRAHDELAQVLLDCLDLGQLGHDVFIPCLKTLVTTGGLRRLARLERRMALSQSIIAVGAHRSYLEACPLELGGKLRRLVQPHAVDLVCAPVMLADLPEADDPALHRPLLRVLLPLCEHRPILPNAEDLRRSAGRHLPGTEYIEDEDTAGDQRLEDAPEEWRQSAGILVEKVVE